GIFWVIGLMYCMIFLYSCDTNSVTVNNDENSRFNTESEWLVPEHEVITGGPGKDGIPPIESPEFKPVDEIDFIPDERRVLGIIKGGEILAYPHQILDWHEIVNDDSHVTITYCPLTATGIAWDPKQGPDFGTSGLIFRNNLVAYDRKTESLWSQMRLRSINGEHLGAGIEPLNVLDTTWETWKMMYPDSKVLTDNTGHSRDYDSYAYGKSYSEIDGIILFPTKNRGDRRLNAKARVHGVFIDEELDENSLVRVYEIRKFDSDIELIHDQLNDEEFIVIGSSKLDFAIAYKAVMRDGVQLFFEAVQDRLPVVMKDQEGTLWNVFGEGVEGPRQGQRLIPAKSYSGYWFAFRDMFIMPEIYQFPTQ
ncbi:MAG: DUF3179 domain-containing protein, partial [Balneolaceae bacterium]